LVQGGQLRPPLRRAPSASRRKRIDHHAAADGARCRRVAQHQPIARQRADRTVERQARQHRVTRLDPLGIQRCDTRRHMRRAQMQVYRRMGTQGARFLGQQREAEIEARRGCVHIRMQHPVAARHRLLGQPRPGDVERDPLAGGRGLGGSVLRMQRAHP